MGPDLVRPLRSTCFLGPPVFSQSIPPSKTKYGLIAFRARARRRARLIREAKLFPENPRRKNKILTDCRTPRTWLDLLTNFAICEKVTPREPPGQRVRRGEPRMLGLCAHFSRGVRNAG